MSHRESTVILSVHETRDLCNGPPGHNFADEDDSSPHGRAFAAPDIQAEIYFLEIRMKRNTTKSEESGAEKSEAHKAYERPAIE
jgi:hypothetical protein